MLRLTTITHKGTKRVKHSQQILRSSPTNNSDEGMSNMKYFLSDILSMVIRAEWHNHPDYQRWYSRSEIGFADYMEPGSTTWMEYYEATEEQAMQHIHRRTGNAAH